MGQESPLGGGFTLAFSITYDARPITDTIAPEGRVAFQS
jgi:hypothetical protein